MLTWERPGETPTLASDPERGRFEEPWEDASPREGPGPMLLCPVCWGGGMFELAYCSAILGGAGE